MSTKIHDLATHAALGVSVAPKNYTANATGDAVDLLSADGNAFAVLAVGSLNGDTAFTASIEESSDLTTWTAVPGVSFPIVNEESTAVSQSFQRTSRYVRAKVTISGDDSDGNACVIVGGQKKTV